MCSEQCDCRCAGLSIVWRGVDMLHSTRLNAPSRRCFEASFAEARRKMTSPASTTPTIRLVLRSRPASTCYDSFGFFCTYSRLHNFFPDVMAALGRPMALRQYICASYTKSWTRARAGLQNSDRIQRRYKYYIAPEGEQARLITGYYAGK